MSQNLKRSNRLENNVLFESENEGEVEAIFQPKKKACYEKIPFFKPLIAIVLFQFVLFFIFSCVLSKSQSMAVLKAFEYVFVYQYNANFFIFVIFYFVLCFISIACVIPSISVVVILLVLVSKDIVFTWTLTMVFYLIIESMLYIIFHDKYKHKIKSYVKDFRYINSVKLFFKLI